MLQTFLFYCFYVKKNSGFLYLTYTLCICMYYVTLVVKQKSLLTGYFIKFVMYSMCISVLCVEWVPKEMLTVKEFYLDKKKGTKSVFI